ncbi:hypothetical protein K7X08_004320 [Anisodus acutangulus]|uniref:F-box domain-containing protein n=1 Tax=Anisodus acutangulus TaxID=402998 RepID=A0A9Q1RJM6_9SOLA|nr:hypothetical protein K7X08_004320 [Anisodus acutangulus]
MEEKSVEDHISKLPVPILQHFLSLLLAKDAAQISTFSKTWYASWTYLSYLNFGDEFFDPEEDDRRILSEKIPQLVNVVDQTLANRQKQKTIKIASDRLEYLALSWCFDLIEVELDTPNLISFKYSCGDELPTVKLMKASVLLEVEVDLFSGERLDSHWYSMLMIFLGNFKQSKAIDLICNKAEAIVIPKDMRKNLVPPLYGTTGSLHIKFQSSENYSLVDVFDSLLWISPQCDTLSFVRVSELNSTLKLIYEDALTEENFLEA